MTKFLLPGLLALAAVTADTRPAAAGTGFPLGPCPYAGGTGCGGYCLNLFGRIHFHGPLYNYGPYSGYYPFEPYGPWTSDLRYNPPQNCGGHGCGGPGWGSYAKDTLKNVFNRLHPCNHKCGGGGCGSGCGTAADGGAGCSSCATALLAGPAPVVVTQAGAAVVLTGR